MQITLRHVNYVEALSFTLTEHGVTLGSVEASSPSVEASSPYVKVTSRLRQGYVKVTSRLRVKV
jgi:hypothetical protein